MLAYLFLALLVKTEAERVRTLGLRPAGSPSAIVTTARISRPQSTPWPGQMSFFSVYCGPTKARSEEDTVVCCRARRAINNLEERVVVTGDVSEDVVDNAGRVLIPVGSKLTGLGFCDPERGRILGRGRWTFFVSDCQIQVEGALLDSVGKEGLAGEESEASQDVAKIKQAIYRDGLYLYVPVGTQFRLRLFGNASIADLGSAFDN
jgi:hypothetical protein